MERKLVLQATILFATSREEKNNFIKAFNVSQQKIKLSPNGVIPVTWERGNHPEIESCKSQGAFYWEHASTEYSDRKVYRFTVGQTMSERRIHSSRHLRQPIAHLKINNVKFLGEIDDEEKKRLYSTVDLAINPAFFEPRDQN